MRPFDHSSISAEAVRELAAVDAVLAGERVPEGLSELEWLTVDLRTERAVLSHEAAARLDALAQRDFGHDAADRALPRIATRLRRLRQRQRRALAPALAAALCLLIAGVGVVSSGVLSDEGVRETQGPVATAPAPAPEPAAPTGSTALESSPGSPSASPERGRTDSAQPPAPLSGQGASGSSPLPPASRRLVPGAEDRKVVHQASLTLAAAPAEVESVADDVVSVVDRHRGFVLSSSVSGGEDAAAGASLELRLPSGRLRPALAELSELAHVRSRTQSTEDVTAAHTSLRGRLSAALAERQGLLRQLARAQTPNETSSVRARLRLVDRRIERLRSSLRSQRERVDYAAVAVSVEADGRQAAGDGAWTPGDALHDALSVLGTTLGIALVALAVLAPIGLIALAIALARRRVVRLKREAALDAASHG